MSDSTIKDLKTTLTIHDLTVNEIKRVYSGRPGCGCGCRGKYYDDGPMFAKTLRILQERADEMEEPGGFGDEVCFAIEDETRYRWLYTTKQALLRREREVLVARIAEIDEAAEQQ